MKTENGGEDGVEEEVEVLDPGNHTVMCRWRDGQLHRADVVERRTSEADPSKYEYYVHYQNFNKRLDE